MRESMWEQYVVRRPELLDIPGGSNVQEVLTTKKVEYEDGMFPSDTGPQIIVSPTLVPGCECTVEYGFVHQDMVMGGASDGVVKPHKHDYVEIFCAWGTDPENIRDLGGEIEFWLGERETLGNVVLTEPGAIYVPKGVAHFPVFFRNVRRPILFPVFAPALPESKRDFIWVDPQGRPGF